MMCRFGWMCHSLVALVLLAGSASAQTSMLMVEGGAIRRGEEGVVSIILDSDGQKNALAFSLHFNPTLIGFLSHEQGHGLPPGSMIFANPTQVYDGRFGCLIGLQPLESLPPGRLEILRLHVHTMPGAQTLSSLIQITDDPVRRSASDPEAAAVRFQSRSGSITLIGDGAPTPTPLPPPVYGQTPPGGAPSEIGDETDGNGTAYAPVPTEAMRELHALFPGMAGLYADAAAREAETASAGATAQPGAVMDDGDVLTPDDADWATTTAVADQDRSTTPAVAIAGQVGPAGADEVDGEDTDAEAIMEYVDPYQYYDIIYKRRGRKAPGLVQVTTGGIQVLPGAASGDTLKITRKAGQTEAPPIRLIQSDGGFRRIYTEAPVQEIRLQGSLASLTARRAHVASVRAQQIGSVVMTAGEGSGAVGTAIAASQPFRRGDAVGRTRIALRGVALEDVNLPAGAWRRVGERPERAARPAPGETVQTAEATTATLQRDRGTGDDTD